MGPPASHAAPEHQGREGISASRLSLSGPSHARLPVLDGGSTAMSNQWLISTVHFGIIPADTNLNAVWGTVANWITWRVTTAMAPQFRLDDRVRRMDTEGKGRNRNVQTIGIATFLMENPVSYKTS